MNVTHEHRLWINLGNVSNVLYQAIYDSALCSTNKVQNIAGK